MTEHDLITTVASRLLAARIAPRVAPTMDDVQAAVTLALDLRQEVAVQMRARAEAVRSAKQLVDGTPVHERCKRCNGPIRLDDRAGWLTGYCSDTLGCIANQALVEQAAQHAERGPLDPRD